MATPDYEQVDGEDETEEDQRAAAVPSSFPEFADCFVFFKKFGAYLSLPDITLRELERFFQRGDLEDVNDAIGEVHYTLFSNITRRPADRDSWIFFAAKLAYNNGWIDGTSDYEDFDLCQRVQLLKFLCDMQFTRNNSFKNHLSKLSEMDSGWLRENPIGLDKQGHRYWLLQDSVYDIRLYSEDKYLEYPFDHPKWNLLCSSEQQLKSFIEQLEKGAQEHEAKDEQSAGKTQCSKRRRSSTSNAKKEEEARGGCVVCKKDTFYSKMLLCDRCDCECHTYCQYPIVWTIPDGEWFCPSCRELELIEDLKRLHFKLIEGMYLCEKQMEEEQKKLKRLQRGGLLVQNIISEEVDQQTDAPRRSGRSKKDINYALLNEIDIHVPVVRSSRATNRLTKAVAPYTVPHRTNYYSTRRTRSNALVFDTADGNEDCSIPEEMSLDKEEEMKACFVKVTTVHEQQSVSMHENQNCSFLCSFPLEALNVSSSQEHSLSSSPLPPPTATTCLTLSNEVTSGLLTPITGERGNEESSNSSACDLVINEDSPESSPRQSLFCSTAPAQEENDTHNCLSHSPATLSADHHSETNDVVVVDKENGQSGIYN